MRNFIPEGTYLANQNVGGNRTCVAKFSLGFRPWVKFWDWDLYRESATYKKQTYKTARIINKTSTWIELWVPPYFGAG